MEENNGGEGTNVLFGDATFGYYETICGGAGATPTSYQYTGQQNV